LEWKMLVYLMAVGNIFKSLGTFYDHLLMLWSYGISYLVLVLLLYQDNLATPVKYNIFYHMDICNVGQSLLNPEIAK
jgi:hypothetical protein